MCACMCVCWCVYASSRVCIHVRQDWNVCVCVCVHEYVYICIPNTFWTLRASRRLNFFFSVTEQYIFDTIIEYTVAPCFVSAAIPEQALMDETKALDLVREASEKLEAAMEQV